MSAAISDISQGLSLSRYWMFSAYVRLQLQYKKTSLSFLWEPLTIHFVAVSLAMVWSIVLGITDPFGFFLYVLFGFSLWGLLSKLIRSGVAVLGKRSSDLTNKPIPISSLVVEEIVLCFYYFFTTLPFLVVWSICFYQPDFTHLGQFLLGMILIFLSAIGLTLSLGILAFLVGDVAKLVAAVMRLSFLVTPIIWTLDRLGEHQKWIWLNPFYSYLDICRSALMGESAHQNSWIVATALTLSLLIIGLITLNFSHKHIRRRAFAK